MDKLVFQEVPSVELGTNIFVNCPIVLQFDDTPLIQIVRKEAAGFTTQIPVHHQDGTYLAKVVGSQIYKTKEGEKAGVVLSHPGKMTVCKLNGKTIFEIRREEAAALKTSAELYTPTGCFVKYTDASPSLITSTGEALQVRGMYMTRSTIRSCYIGVWVKSDGSVAVGCAKPKAPVKKPEPA